MPDNGGIGMQYYALGIDAGRSVKDAAKWLLAAFAAVFAVLTAGLQFSSLVEIANSPWALAALICGSIAFIAVLVVIFSAAKVLIDPGVSFDDLLNGETAAKVHDMYKGKHPNPGQDVSIGALSANDVLLRLGSIKGLTHQQTDSPTEIRDALRNARRDAISATADTTRREMAAEADVLLILGSANKFHNAQIFSVLMRRVKMAAVVVPLAVLGMIWISAIAHPSSALVSQPINARLFLSDDVDQASLGLGKSCSTKNLEAVIIGGTLDQPLVTTAPTSICLAAKFVVTPSVGVTVPMLD